MALAEPEVVETPSLETAALEAWSARAKLDESAAINSFQHQLWAKLKISRESYEIDLDMFDDEEVPRMRLGVVIDGLTFCLDKDQALSVVDWRCSQKGCWRVRRSQVKDLVSLGRALALGDQTAERFPKCDQHS